MVDAVSVIICEECERQICKRAADGIWIEGRKIVWFCSPECEDTYNDGHGRRILSNAGPYSSKWVSER